jgi:hypothetical protein
MNKTILILFLAAVFLTFNVSAWHCVDKDQATPTKYPYGTWGDNGLLNGTTVGWSADGKAPAGCTGTQGNFACADRCDGTTLVEYYCGDRPSEQVCDRWNYDRNHHKTTCKSWKTTSFAGETVIFSKDYTNSAQCGGHNEVPEFGVVAGAIALIGAAGIVLLFKRQ